MVTIGEIADATKLRGNKYHKYGDMPVSQRYNIDYSQGRRRGVINTSVDCYVAGSYVNNKGQSIDIKQRYTIFVAYSAQSQSTAMRDVRTRIMQDFTMRFPDFKISDVFIPENAFVMPPKGYPAEGNDVTFYTGSDLFRRMSKIDVAEYRAATEEMIYRARLEKAKKYGL
jgi:hypothetical protein